MQCDDVAELLLAPEADPELDRHVQACARCAHLARGLGRLNAVLQSTLVCEPPPDLQRQLADLALGAAARPRRASWWSRLFGIDLGSFKPGEWALRPNVVAAQGLAAVMLALAGWQVFAWLNTFQPVVGDVGYAVELVATSPAAAYVGGMQLDLQSLSLWSLVGLLGWLVSDNTPIGRRLATLRLP